MNYTEKVKLKHKLERRMKFISIIPAFIFLAMVFQMVLLLLGVETVATWFNIVLIDQLFANASAFFQVDNLVLSFMFYGAVALTILIMLACAVFCYKKIRFSFELFFIAYAIDTFLAALSVNYVQIVIHGVLLALVFIGIRTLKTLEIIPKDVWGYEE